MDGMLRELTLEAMETRERPFADTAYKEAVFSGSLDGPHPLPHWRVRGVREEVPMLGVGVGTDSEDDDSGDDYEAAASTPPVEPGVGGRSLPIAVPAPLARTCALYARELDADDRAALDASECVLALLRAIVLPALCARAMGAHAHEYTHTGLVCAVRAAGVQWVGERDAYSGVPGAELWSPPPAYVRWLRVGDPLLVYTFGVCPARALALQLTMACVRAAAPCVVRTVEHGAAAHARWRERGSDVYDGADNEGELGRDAHVRHMLEATADAVAGQARYAITHARFLRAPPPPPPP